MGHMLILACMASSLFNGDSSAAQSVKMTDSTPARPLATVIRPAALAPPMAALAYGCLKPAVAGIARIDDRLWQRTALSAGAQDAFPVETILQWTPTASIYIMDAAGVRLRNRFRDHLLIDAGSILLAGGAGWVMRKISGRMPDFGLKPGTEFPSGHATNAFRGAEILRQEWKARSPAWSWTGYAMATCVSLLRMKHGQHQLSEVVAGAGLGVLSTQAAYWIKNRMQMRAMRRRP